MRNFTMETEDGEMLACANPSGLTRKNGNGSSRPRTGKRRQTPMVLMIATSIESLPEARICSLDDRDFQDKMTRCIEFWKQIAGECLVQPHNLDMGTTTSITRPFSCPVPNTTAYSHWRIRCGAGGSRISSLRVCHRHGAENGCFICC